jgi:hypothetical protein
MAAMLDFECGRKRLRLARFQDDPTELVGVRHIAELGARAKFVK